MSEFSFKNQEQWLKLQIATTIILEFGFLHFGACEKSLTCLTATQANLNYVIQIKAKEKNGALRAPFFSFAMGQYHGLYYLVPLIITYFIGFGNCC